MNLNRNSYRELLEVYDLPLEMMDELIAISSPMEVKNQHSLINAGGHCDSIFYVLKGGFVCRYTEYKSGTERTINFYLDALHPFMTCIDSYFDGSKTNCQLRAISDSLVLGLKKKDLEDLATHFPKFKKFYYNMIVEGLLVENNFRIKLITQPPEMLYTYLILKRPILIRNVPAKYIAEFMGISQEWLCKLKRKAYLETKLD